MLSVDATGRTTFTFDADGNELAKEEPLGDRTTNTWDYENQNTRVELPNSDIVTYTYNSNEMLVARTDPLNVMTTLVYDTQNVLVETDDLGNFSAQYTYEPAVQYGNLVSQHRDTASTFYHFDALGSTGALTDSAEVISDSYSYTGFGELNDSTGTTANPYQWVGQIGYRKDDDTGRYNIRRRDYESAFGRFLSEDLEQDDPLGNRYRYVENSPINFTDPSGLLPLTDAEMKRLEQLLEKEARGEKLSPAEIEEGLKIARKFPPPIRLTPPNIPGPRFPGGGVSPKNTDSIPVGPFIMNIEECYKENKKVFRSKHSIGRKLPRVGVVVNFKTNLKITARAVPEETPKEDCVDDRGQVTRSTRFGSNLDWKNKEAGVWYEITQKTNVSSLKGRWDLTTDPAGKIKITGDLDSHEETHHWLPLCCKCFKLTADVKLDTIGVVHGLKIMVGWFTLAVGVHASALRAVLNRILREAMKAFGNLQLPGWT